MNDLEKLELRVTSLENRVDTLEGKPPSVKPPVPPPPEPLPPGKPKGWEEGDHIIYFGTGRNDHNIQYDFLDGKRSTSIDDTCPAGTTNWYYFDIPELSDLVDGDSLSFHNSVVNHAVRDSGVFLGSVSFQQGDRVINRSCCRHEIATVATTSKNGIDFGKPFYWKIHQNANAQNTVGGYRFSWGIYTFWQKDYPNL